MWLLDGNLLVALAIDTHEFHDPVQRSPLHDVT